MKLMHLTSIVCVSSFVFVASVGAAARTEEIVVDACVADDDGVAADDDEDDGGWDIVDEIDQEPGDIVIDGTVLYSVEVYGYGLCPQFGFNKHLRKATEACKAAGGVLKLGKPVIHAYDISVFGWCYKPNK